MRKQVPNEAQLFYQTQKGIDAFLSKTLTLQISCLLIKQGNESLGKCVLNVVLLQLENITLMSEDRYYKKSDLFICYCSNWMYFSKNPDDLFSSIKFDLEHVFLSKRAKT